MAVRTTRGQTSLYASSNIQPGTFDPWTLCAFVKLRTDHNDYAQFFGHYHSSQPLALQVGNDGVSLTMYASGTDNDFTYDCTVDRWFFCGLRRTDDGTGAEAFVYDPVSDTWETVSEASHYYTGSATYVTVGNWQYGGSDGVDADFAGIKHWSAYLTDDELKREARTLRPQRTANLLRWSPALDVTVANAYKDWSGNGYDWSAYESGGSLSSVDGPPISYGAPPIIIPQYAASIVVPTLSLPGVQSITANSAVPKVTLTW